jgi:hypothetical protein
MTYLKASGGDNRGTRGGDIIRAGNGSLHRAGGNKLGHRVKGRREDGRRVEKLDVLGQRRGDRVPERANAGLSGLDMGEDREFGRKEVVCLGDRDLDLEYVTGGRNWLGTDIVL